MAQPPPQPQPQSWYPVASTRGPQGPVIGIIAAVVIVAAFLVIGLLFTAFTGGFFPGAFGAIICLPFLFVIVFIIIAIASTQARRQIPPPPPIQQPMVPAGQQPPVALNCPNCGGPPQNVDRFGVATCGYCGTRFLVR